MTTLTRHPAYASILDEIHAQMGRHRMTQVALAARLGQNQPWLNRRLMGHTPMTVPELESVAAALDLTLTELVSLADRNAPVLPRDRSTGWFRSKRAKPRRTPHHGALFPPGSPDRVTLLRPTG
jgi:transcriptional regulator with XRE-family HTH domain